MEQSQRITNEELSEAERKVVFLMRSLRPFERIEIKLHDAEMHGISIVATMTTKEIFPSR